MKTLFYDMKAFNLNYLQEHLPKNIEPYYFKFPITPKTFIDEKIKDAEVLCVFVSSELNYEVLSKFKNLKYILLRSQGYSNVDLKYCQDKNIKIYNAPDYGSSSVAEYAFGLILSLIRKISYSENELKKGFVEQEEIMGFELQNKTLGIIGTGAIGKKIIEISKGFSLNILANDIVKNGDYNYVELDELLKSSDIIVISCPLTEQTRGLIGRREFLKMKKTSVLINVARGEIVDTFELVRALREKQIKGAGLDVVECENKLCNLWNKCNKSDLKDTCARKYLFVKELMELDNVILTPHNAYNTKEANEKIMDITLNNLLNISNNQISSKNSIN